MRTYRPLRLIAIKHLTGGFGNRWNTIDKVFRRLGDIDVHEGLSGPAALSWAQNLCRETDG